MLSLLGIFITQQNFVGANSIVVDDQAQLTYISLFSFGSYKYQSSVLLLSLFKR
jgi:hypothetical protein